MRQCRCSHKGAVRDLHAVEHFIAFLQAAQDRDRVLHRRLIHHDRLEPPLQCRILLNVLAVLVKGRSADTVQFAPCQHGFQHVPRIHGTVRLSGSHNGMQLIDEQDDPAFAVLHFFQDRFQTLLKLAPVFCAGDKGSHIKGKYRLLFQSLRYIAADDPLSQPFHDRRFTDARFSDEDRIVLRLTG